MKEEPALRDTPPTEVSEEIQKEFKNMDGRTSSEYQLSQWVEGRSLHNPVRDECCPDFSCCHPEGLMDKNLRIKFSNAHKMNDTKTTMSILGMALGVTSSAGLNVHIAGENNTLH
ncbi:MAG: hypothetical protein GY797_38940 [Deltaproteobacteria bacterium]|nr:hypothetical protein [Deltaproteobacteria bacterium]